MGYLSEKHCDRLFWETNKRFKDGNKQRNEVELIWNFFTMMMVMMMVMMMMMMMMMMILHVSIPKDDSRVGG